MVEGSCGTKMLWRLESDNHGGYFFIGRVWDGIVTFSNGCVIVKTAGSRQKGGGTRGGIGDIGGPTFSKGERGLAVNTKRETHLRHRERESPSGGPAFASRGGITPKTGGRLPYRGGRLHTGVSIRGWF